MNIQFDIDEFEEFIVLYLREMMKDNGIITPISDNMTDLIENMKTRSIMPLMNKIVVSTNPRLRMLVKMFAQSLLKLEEDSTKKIRIMM